MEVQKQRVIQTPSDRKRSDGRTVDDDPDWRFFVDDLLSSSNRMPLQLSSSVRVWGKVLLVGSELDGAWVHSVHLSSPFWGGLLWNCAAASGLPPLVPGASWICNLQGELGADLWPTSALHSGRREQHGPRSWRNERETSRLTRQQSSWSICQTCTMPVCLSCHCASPVGSVIMIQ